MLRIYRISRSKGIKNSLVEYKCIGSHNGLDKTLFKEVNKFYKSVDSLSKRAKIMVYYDNKLELTDDALVILFSSIYNLIIRGYNVGIDSNFFKEMKRVNVFSFMPLDVGVINIGKRISNGKKKVNIGFVDHNKLQKEFVLTTCNTILKYITNIEGEKIPDEIFTPVGESMYNASEHSEGNYHFFSSKVTKKKEYSVINYNIIDYGVTIVSKIEKHFNRLNLSKRKSIDYFRWAITHGNTTRNNDEGGNGFTALKSCICDKGDNLMVISGDILYNKTIADETYISLPFNFPGTVIHITIKLSNNFSKDVILTKKATMVKGMKEIFIEGGK